MTISVKLKSLFERIPRIRTLTPADEGFVAYIRPAYIRPNITIGRWWEDRGLTHIYAVPAFVPNDAGWQYPYETDYGFDINKSLHYSSA